MERKYRYPFNKEDRLYCITFIAYMLELLSYYLIGANTIWIVVRTVNIIIFHIGRLTPLHVVGHLGLYVIGFAIFIGYRSLMYISELWSYRDHKNFIRKNRIKEIKDTKRMLK